MASFELLSDQDLRLDGRRAGELRRLRCRLGVFGQADGSAYLEMGNTKVLAAVYGPHEARGAARARSDWKSVVSASLGVDVMLLLPLSGLQATALL